MSNIWHYHDDEENDSLLFEPFGNGMRVEASGEEGTSGVWFDEITEESLLAYLLERQIERNA